MESNSFRKKIMCEWCGEKEVEVEGACCDKDCHDSLLAEKEANLDGYLRDY